MLLDRRQAGWQKQPRDATQLSFLNIVKNKAFKKINNQKSCIEGLHGLTKCWQLDRRWCLFMFHDHREGNSAEKQYGA